MAGIEVHLEELVQPRRCLGAKSHFRRRNRRNKRDSVWRFVTNQLNRAPDGAQLGSHACGRGPSPPKLSIALYQFRFKHSVPRGLFVVRAVDKHARRFLTNPVGWLPDKRHMRMEL